MSKEVYLLMLEQKDEVIQVVSPILLLAEVTVSVKKTSLTVKECHEFKAFPQWKFIQPET